MNSLLTFLSLLCFAQLLWVVQSARKPLLIKEQGKIYQPSKDRVLTFVRSPKLSFVNAVTECAVRGEVLAEFKDEADLTFLTETLKKNEVLPGMKDEAYINVGGMYVGPVSDQYDMETTKMAPKVFQWFESGSDITLWGKDQPDKLKGKGWDENCVVVYRGGAGTYTVGDHTCAPKRAFICSNLNPNV